MRLVVHERWWAAGLLAGLSLVGGCAQSARTSVVAQPRGALAGVAADQPTAARGPVLSSEAAPPPPAPINPRPADASATATAGAASRPRLDGVAKGSPALRGLKQSTTVAANTTPVGERQPRSAKAAKAKTTDEPFTVRPIAPARPAVTTASAPPPSQLPAELLKPAGPARDLTAAAIPAQPPIRIPAVVQLAAATGDMEAAANDGVEPATIKALAGKPRATPIMLPPSAPCGPKIVPGHAPDYSWLIGEIEFLQTRGDWRLRYGNAEDEDRYGGTVTLGGDNLPTDSQSGQLVRVEGYLVNPQASEPRPLYWVQSLSVLKAPAVRP